MTPRFTCNLRGSVYVERTAIERMKQVYNSYVIRTN